MKILLFKNRDALNEHFVKGRAEDTAKYEELDKKVLEFYQKTYKEGTTHLSYAMFDFDFYGFGYNINDGYYIVDYDTSNSFIMMSYGEDIEGAFIYLANKILDKNRMEYERENRKSIKKDYNTRFSKVKYYDRLLKAEYDLTRWNKYYEGNVPEELIELYLKYINNTYGLYEANGYFEYENNAIVYKDYQPKTRSLSK